MTILLTIIAGFIFLVGLVISWIMAIMSIYEFVFSRNIIRRCQDYLGNFAFACNALTTLSMFVLFIYVAFFVSHS